MSHRFAIVENSIVINVFCADENFVNQFYPNAINVDDSVCVGDSYENGKFFRPIIVDNNNAETL